MRDFVLVWTPKLLAVCVEGVQRWLVWASLGASLGSSGSRRLEQDRCEKCWQVCTLPAHLVENLAM